VSFVMVARLAAFSFLMCLPSVSFAFQSRSRYNDNDLGTRFCRGRDTRSQSCTSPICCEASQETRRAIIKRVVRLSCLVCASGRGLAFAPRTAIARETGDSSPTHPTSESAARSGRQPYAPIENLLPATRVRVLIDRAVDISSTLVQLQKEASADKNVQTEKLIADLNQLLLEPQQFMTPEEEFAAKRYLEQKTWGDWNKARRKETQEMFQIEFDPATRANEAFEQWGERRQFKRLRRQQLALEQSNNMRAAFNAYTNNLVFGESYTLNASKEERKRLIRTYDQLPDVTSVIRSDLDLRDLYRNQVLTYMDDAKAELEYQLKKSGEPFDASDLLSVLIDAQSSCSEWFKFVPENDAKDALSIVREG